MRKLILAVALLALGACKSPTAADPCAGLWYDTTAIVFTEPGKSGGTMAQQEWAHAPAGCTNYRPAETIR